MELDKKQAEEWLEQHRCGCEVCATTSSFCPASISSIALEYVQLRRNNQNLKMDVNAMQQRINVMESRQIEKGVPWASEREAYDKGVINGHIGAMVRR